MTTPLVSPPLGRDVSATTHVHRGRVVSGARLIAEALFRRITTPRGRLLSDPNYGIDVFALLNAEMTPEYEATIPPRVRAECSKEPRVQDVKVTLVRVSGTVSREYELTISGTTAEGPFELSLAVNDVNVRVLSLPEAA